MELIKKRLGQYKSEYFTTEQHEEIIEIIVPDINPDFENTISNFSVCSISDKSLLSGYVKITGQIDSIINYSSSASECAYTINSSTPFSKSIKIENSQPDDTLICDVKVYSTETEILNSRKIRIKVSMSIVCWIIRLENAELIEEICGEAGENVFSLVDSEQIMPCIDIIDGSIKFVEEIRLTDDEALNYFRFIRWEDCWAIDDVKIMHNRIMVRGHIQITVLSTNDSSLDVINKSYILPFSQVIDCKNTFEDDDVNCSIKCNSARINLIKKEEVYYLRCECNAVICIHTHRRMDIKYLSDIYSTKYGIAAKNNSFFIKCNSEQCKNDNAIEERVDTQGVAVELVDCSVLPVLEIHGDKAFYKYNVSLIYCDAEAQYRFFSSTLSAITNINKEMLSSNICCAIKDIKTNIDPTGVIISFVSCISGTTEETCKIEAITSCSIDKTTHKSTTSRGNLVLRKVLTGESIWSIAKQYCTSPDAIIAANELQDLQVLPDGKLIMIPFIKQ